MSSAARATRSTPPSLFLQILYLIFKPVFPARVFNIEPGFLLSFHVKFDFGVDPTIVLFDFIVLSYEPLPFIDSSLLFCLLSLLFSNARLLTLLLIFLY